MRAIHRARTAGARNNGQKSALFLTLTLQRLIGTPWFENTEMNSRSSLLVQREGQTHSRDGKCTIKMVQESACLPASQGCSGKPRYVMSLLIAHTARGGMHTADECCISPSNAHAEISSEPRSICVCVALSCLLGMQALLL